VPERCADELMRLWVSDVFEQATIQAAQILAESKADMPTEQRAAFEQWMTTISPAQAALRAGCTRRTIDRAISDGHLEISKGTSGRVAIRLCSFEAWLEGRGPSMSNNVQTRPEQAAPAARASVS
jgi:hypothetical protein